jgi:hypothetical protein
MALRAIAQLGRWTKLMAVKCFDEFPVYERERIFIAANLNEAEKVERILKERDIEYAVNIEPYYRISPFQTEHQGVAFYVKSEHADFFRTILKEKGLGTGVVDI